MINEVVIVFIILFVLTLNKLFIKCCIIFIFIYYYESRGRNVFDCEISENTANIFKFTLNGNVLIEDARELTPLIPTYFLIHGWYENITERSYYDIIATTLFTNETCNVVLVDYQHYAAEFYTCAHIIADVVGKYVGEFIAHGIKEKYLDSVQIHIIAQSMGAHVAGVAGRTVYDLTNFKIRRISAMDPAGPLFQFGYASNNALKPSDANVVDVLHCSITFGTFRRMGTVDFYATSILGQMYAILQKPCIYEPFDVVCSHKMAKRYYNESIKSCGFRATEVTRQAVAVYGHRMDESITGVYVFETGYSRPYGTFNSTCII